MGRAAFALLLWAPALGCGPSVSAYRGVGSLRPSGEAELLSPETARLDVCPPPPRPSTEDAVSARAEPDLVVLTIGRTCSLAGAWDGSAVSFGSSTPAECTLQFPEGPRRLRVESLTVASRPGVLRVVLGGFDVTTGRYALYRFQETAQVDGPAPEGSACARVALEPRE